MPIADDSLYQLSFGDASRAGEAMADAFADDPLWRKVFEGESDLVRRAPAFFEIPIRHCLRYGWAYAPSERLEGIVAFVPGRVSGITLWRLLRSGSLRCAGRMGKTVTGRMAGLRVLDTDRAQHFSGRPYLYLMLLGVRTEHQGQGVGGSLLRALLAYCDEQGLALYLETETDQNVRMYERFGFRVIRRITIQALGVPVWELVRDARGEIRRGT